MPPQVNMVDADGNVVPVPEAQIGEAQARGLRLESVDENVSRVGEDIKQDKYGGAVGKVASLGAGALRGLTFGGSDVAFSALGGADEIDALRDVNPITSTVGEVGGTLVGSFAAPGSLLGRAPASVVSRASMRAFEGGKAIGGLRGTAQALAATGAEGALQSGGMYLSDVALGDRELTAEGMAGSLGHGFAFGTVAGGALLGVEKGTMAARRMFARTAEGGDKAAQLAATTWERESRAILEANDAAAEIARSKLAELRGIRDQAGLVKQQAGARYAEERALAARGALDAPPAPAGIADDVAGAAEGAAVHPLGAGAAAEEQKLASVLAERDEALSAFTAMRKRIEAGEIPGEVGPFTPKGVDLAAERQLAREAGGAPTLGEVASGKARAAVEEPAPGTFGADDYDPFAVAPPPRKAKAPKGSPAADAPGSVFAKHKLTSRIEESGAEVQLHLDGPDGQAGRLLMRRGKDGEFRLSHVEVGSEALQGKGVGSAMYREMADYLEKKHGAKLLSDYSRSPQAERVWERFAKEGKARGVWEKGDDLAGPPGYYVMEATPAAKIAPATATAARSAPMSLEEQLAATQAKLSEGSTLAEIGRTRTAHPTSPKQLEQAYDDLVERAAQATDAGTKQQLLREADAIEQQFGPRAGNAVDDATNMADVTTRLEKANADVVEALGDAAPQAARDSAKAYRAAEATAERKAMDRTTRAVDDAAEEAAKAPPPPTAKERVAAAKADKLDAEAAFRRAATNETEARIGERAARTMAKEARAKAAEQAANAKLAGETIGLPGQPSAVAGKGGMLADMGAVLEAANMVGIPGLPKPSDIPIIGPLLGGYLKFRALKAAAGRFTGRVAVTGESKAAALAAKTKDKIARAVDHSLGLIERNAGRARAPAVAASVRAMDALRRRVFDDGEPDAPKDATLTEVAAVRMREIAHAATNPQAIIAQVRKEMREVYDPDLIAAAEKQRIATITHLNDKAPKAPPPNPFSKREWTPTIGAASQWARRLEVANDPLAAFEALDRQSLTPEAADTLRAVYPKLFAQAQQRFLERAADVEHPIPYKQQLRNSLLFDVALDPSMESESMQILASAHAKVMPDAQPQPAQPPAPSIAGGGNLTALYQTTADRRAMR